MKTVKKEIPYVRQTDIDKIRYPELVMKLATTKGGVITKQDVNIQHDNEITLRFESRGWTVIRIWECELKKKNREKLRKKLGPLICS